MKGRVGARESYSSPARCAEAGVVRTAGAGRRRHRRFVANCRSRATAAEAQGACSSGGVGSDAEDCRVCIIFSHKSKGHSAQVYQGKVYQASAHSPAVCGHIQKSQRNPQPTQTRHGASSGSHIRKKGTRARRTRGVHSPAPGIRRRRQKPSAPLPAAAGRTVPTLPSRRRGRAEWTPPPGPRREHGGGCRTTAALARPAKMAADPSPGSPPGQKESAPRKGARLGSRQARRTARRSKSAESRL